MSAFPDRTLNGKLNDRPFPLHPLTEKTQKYTCINTTCIERVHHLPKIFLLQSIRRGEPYWKTDGLSGESKLTGPIPSPSGFWPPRGQERMAPSELRSEALGESHLEWMGVIPLRPLHPLLLLTDYWHYGGTSCQTGPSSCLHPWELTLPTTKLACCSTVRDWSTACMKSGENNVKSTSTWHCYPNKVVIACPGLWAESQISSITGIQD